MRGDLQHALECECCSSRIDILHDFLAEADALVAKALKLSETAQIAKTEQRMRELLLVKWRNRADQAAAAAGRAVAGGASVAAALRSVDRIMPKWETDVALRYARDLEDVYYLARTAGWKKATKQTSVSLGYDVPNFTEQLPEEEVKKAAATAGVAPAFDLYDKSAVAALRDDQMLWIGDHYDKNVSVSIRAATTRDIIAGKGRIEAGKAMREHVRSELGKVNVPKGFHGSDAKYMEGLAANAATVARVRGQIRSFQDAGITRYEIVNPNDRRTSPQCQHMSGKTFTVKNAVEQIESEAGATEPAVIKGAHPWLSMDQMKKISPTSGHVGGAKGTADSRKLAASGQSLPPYHFRCRSTVDVSVEAGSWKPLGATEQKPVKPPIARPTPKPGKPPRPTTNPPAIPPGTRAATIPPEGQAFAELESLRTAEVASIEELGGGINGSHLVKYKDGKKVVWKPVSGETKLRNSPYEGTLASREAATYKLDRMIGTNIVPRTTTRKIGGSRLGGSVQEYADDALPARKLSDAERIAFNQHNGKRLTLLDAITGNPDRHVGNIMYRKGAKGRLEVIAIDNGFAMPSTRAKKAFDYQYLGGFPESKAIRTPGAVRQFTDFTEHAEQLRAVKLPEVARMLAAEGIDARAARGVVGRIRALQRAPKAFHETGGRMYWIEEGWQGELSALELNEVDVAIKAAYP